MPGDLENGGCGIAVIVSMLPLVSLEEPRSIGMGEMTIHARLVRSERTAILPPPPAAAAVDVVLLLLPVGGSVIRIADVVGEITRTIGGVDAIVVIEIEGGGDGRRGGGDGHALVGAGVSVRYRVRVRFSHDAATVGPFGIAIVVAAEEGGVETLLLHIIL